MKDILDNNAMNEELDFLSKKILDLNKKLIDSEKAKSRFLSLVASELNNPMTALLGMIPHLKVVDDEQNKKIFDLIYNEVLKLNFRIQNLVMAAEIESGTIDISKSSFEVKNIVDDVIKSLKYLVQERNIQINIINKITKKIIADPKKVYIIVKNLISNGCKYGIENGIVDIVLEIKDAMLTITVKNEGDGPHINYKPEVFTRFAKDTVGEHGLGLGLSIVRELCERLDGSIDYTAEEGVVTFIVKLSFDDNENEVIFDSFDNAIEI
ncbi:HAMP domain-containing histidine kinase [bacterium]|nr:HAMP domain-containing histidine kinase [bacterium]MBU1883056.1 HAMP domain-containing histidine kinase [bacterium]